MIGFLLDYWVQAALLLCILGSVWWLARALRERAPYLLDATPGADASVEVGEEGVGLKRKGRKKTLPWREVAVVTVRTTGNGPLAEDLYLEFEGTPGFGMIRVPSGAEGFDGLLRSVARHLPGFDMEGVVSATMRMDESECVVWRRG